MNWRRMDLFLLIGLVALSSLSCSKKTTNQEAPTMEMKEKAVDAAKGWLALVDQGKYGESWEQAAGLFRKAVPKGQWEQQIKGAREPLGKVISREVESTTYATALPGAPDGQYVVIQFKTSFESKKSAVETVTPLLDEDGQWHVSGYFIK